MRTFCWCSSLGARCENNMIVSANTSHRVLFCVLYHRNLNQSDLENTCKSFLSLHCHCDQSSVRGVISYHRNSQFLFLFVSPLWNVLCPLDVWARCVWSMKYVVTVCVCEAWEFSAGSAGPGQSHSGRHTGNCSNTPSPVNTPQWPVVLSYTTVERLGCVDLNMRVTEDWPWGCLGVIRPTLIFKWTKIPSLCDCGLIQNYECSVKNYHVHVLFLSVGLFWFTLQLAASLSLVVQDEW